MDRFNSNEDLTDSERERFRDNFVEDILTEREYQIEKWGHQFDSKNTMNDWMAYIVSYLGKAYTYDGTPEDFCKYIVKTATLCMAAYEQISLGQYGLRHFDPKPNLTEDDTNV